MPKQRSCPRAKRKGVEGAGRQPMPHKRKRLSAAKKLADGSLGLCLMRTSFKKTRLLRGILKPGCHLAWHRKQTTRTVTGSGSFASRWP